MICGCSKHAGTAQSFFCPPTRASVHCDSVQTGCDQQQIADSAVSWSVTPTDVGRDRSRLHTECIKTHFKSWDDVGHPNSAMGPVMHSVRHESRGQLRWYLQNQSFSGHVNRMVTTDTSSEKQKLVISCS